MRAAHAAALVRDRLQVAVVGDITAAELGPLLDRLFGAPARGPARRCRRSPRPARAGALAVIDLDIPQSVVVFGHGGIARDDPDFIPAFVMDHILGGGGFGSRLTEEVREKRGLTYGIYTYLAPDDFGWLYMGRFSSANARVAEAIAIVRDEWARMAGGGRDRGRARGRQALPDRRLSAALRRQRPHRRAAARRCRPPASASTTSTRATSWSRR